MLHVFTDSAVTFGGVTYEAGDEIFAFIPKDLLSRLEEFSLIDTHIYTVDGSPPFTGPAPEATVHITT